MLVIDIFVLRQYFSGGAYSIFRAPALCDVGLTGHAARR